MESTAAMETTTAPATVSDGCSAQRDSDHANHCNKCNWPHGFSPIF
jgi:hypothetical protein